MPRLLALLIALTTAVPARAQRPTAIADGESLQGEKLASGIAVFRGVPYALPPVGDLRWRPPAPRPIHAGRRDATRFGPSCMQGDRLRAWAKGIATALGTVDRFTPAPLDTSEDCLYLNVWAATPVGRANQPVLVWIHGGSNLNGEGHDPWYDGENLARRGVVVVTINYRLGIFGFLAHPALTEESGTGSSGNYALLDQVEALRWVRRNIAAFGGDPSRVTIAGESAGAIDVMHLMAAPLAKGLFQRAIAESGAPMARLLPLRAAESQGLAALKALDLDSTDPLRSLRAVPAGEILAAGNKAMATGQLMGPIVDGRVLPEMTVQAFEAGRQHRVPLLLGSNALEMTTLRAYMPRFVQTPAGYARWLGVLLGPSAQTVQARFPATTPAEVDRQSLEVFTDVFFTCPTRIAARTSAGAAPVYLYQFTRVYPGGESLGAFHAMEIPYVFGNWSAWLPASADDRRMSDAMMGYWTRFAATGDPNGAGAPTWPRYDGTASYLEFGATPVARQGLKGEVCDAIEPRLRATWATR